MEATVGTVTIGCRITNGVVLRRHEEGPDDGTGAKRIVPCGPKVRLNGPPAIASGTTSPSAAHASPGLTKVDAEWWDVWSAENRKSTLIAGGFVFLVDEKAEE